MHRRHPVVLFVDDNLTQLDLYTLLVERDFSVEKATRAETAFRFASAEPPDVIVLDVLLPDDDGVTLAKRLRENSSTSRVPIIVLTADDAAYVRARTSGIEFSEVLRKPCPADRLLTAIADAIRS